MELFGLNICLVSLHQEKPFKQVNHALLHQTLEAFGFGPCFTSTIQLLYQDNIQPKDEWSAVRPIQPGSGTGGLRTAFQLHYGQLLGHGGPTPDSSKCIFFKAPLAPETVCPCDPIPKSYWIFTAILPLSSKGKFLGNFSSSSPHSPVNVSKGAYSFLSPTTQAISGLSQRDMPHHIVVIFISNIRLYFITYFPCIFTSNGFSRSIVFQMSDSCKHALYTCSSCIFFNSKPLSNHVTDLPHAFM